MKHLLLSLLCVFSVAAFAEDKLRWEVGVSELDAFAKMSGSSDRTLGANVNLYRRLGSYFQIGAEIGEKYVSEKYVNAWESSYGLGVRANYQFFEFFKMDESYLEFLIHYDIFRAENFRETHTLGTLTFGQRFKLFHNLFYDVRLMFKGMKIISDNEVKPEYILDLLSLKYQF